ncbi:histidine phosphatase family protein [Angustibacter luteus]|uniref:Histidine phosphatase family protein n=1 Tax=Angustibacter luteus TaxID=658456 RepID=A0ABW1JBF6_9ACTN
MTLRLSLISAGRPADANRAHRLTGAFAGWDAVRGPGSECARASALAGLVEPVPVAADLTDWDLGRWTGQDIDVLAAAEPDLAERWLTDPTFDAHGGESLLALQERAGRWLDGVADRRRGRLVAVAPGPWVRAVVCVTAGVAPQGFWRLDVEPLAVVELTLRPGRRALRWSA